VPGPLTCDVLFVVLRGVCGGGGRGTPGVGFYSTFSLSDSPIIVSGNEAMVFHWGGPEGRRLLTARRPWTRNIAVRGPLGRGRFWARAHTCPSLSHSIVLPASHTHPLSLSLPLSLPLPLSPSPSLSHTHAHPGSRCTR
jgi:hypothetical protein